VFPHSLGGAPWIPEQDRRMKMMKRKSWCEDRYTMTTYVEKRRRRTIVEKRRQKRRMKIVGKRMKDKRMRRRKMNPWCEEH
jgi:hypothetical protein